MVRVELTDQDSMMSLEESHARGVLPGHFPQEVLVVGTSFTERSLGRVSLWDEAPDGGDVWHGAPDVSSSGASVGPMRRCHVWSS